MLDGDQRTFLGYQGWWITLEKRRPDVDKLNGMIEVSRLKDLNAAKLFLGFRIRAIRRRDFAFF